MPIRPTPYSDAFSTITLTPKYDTHQDLYNRALTLLNEAIVELAKTNATIKLAAASDLIHGGVLTRWIKTAQALKARMLIKVSKLASYNAASVLTAIDNAYTSNADDAGMAAFQLRQSVRVTGSFFIKTYLVFIIIHYGTRV